MKLLLIILFFIPGFATAAQTKSKCDVCVVVDKEVQHWNAADTPAKQMQASEESHKLLQRLADELKKNLDDRERIRATVKLLGAIYAQDSDPLDNELEMFRDDFLQPKFKLIFEEEAKKLPPTHKEKLMAGIEAFKAQPELDDDTVPE
jgi:hypothetical protein